jgi:hypothetical protein
MSVKYVWDIPDVPLFNKTKAINLLKTEILKSSTIMSNVVATNIIFSAPVGATGLLKNSIRYEATVDYGRVWSAVGYAPFVEYGRRPGRMPPLQPIIRWLQKAPKGMRRFAGIMASGKVSAGNKSQAYRQAAYIIARAIGKRAHGQTHFLKEVMTDRKKDLDERVLNYFLV